MVSAFYGHQKAIAGRNFIRGAFRAVSKQVHKQQQAKERGDFVTTEREAISSTKGKKVLPKRWTGREGDGKPPQATRWEGCHSLE